MREGRAAMDLQLDADVRLLRAEHVAAEAALDADDLRDAVHRVAVAVADVDAHERADERALKVRLLEPPERGWRRASENCAGELRGENCAELRGIAHELRRIIARTVPSSSA